MGQLIRPRVFVCHNSEDKLTAEKIAIEIIKAGHEAFFDKWDIRPGDSLIEKISEGISDSSYLLVVLSRNSVKSNWVKRELEIALSRQIADKAIKVIPCLLEDCEIPVFLQPISYADFRGSFEHGIAELLPAIEKVDGIASGRLRIGDEAWTHDFAVDYALPDPRSGEYSLKFVILSWYGTEEFSCYWFIDCLVGKRIGQRLSQYPRSLSFGRYAYLLGTVKLELERIIEKQGRDVGIYLPDAREHKVIISTREYESKEPIIDIEMRARRLGKLGSKATMLYIGHLLNEFIDNSLVNLNGEIPEAERKRLVKWIERHPLAGKVKAESSIQEIY